MRCRSTTPERSRSLRWGNCIARSAPLAIEFSARESLHGPDAEAAARLARLAFNDFYSLFTNDETKILASLREQFAGSSELNSLIAAHDAARLVGIACFYPVGEMQARQMEGVRSLLRVADDSLRSGKALREFVRNFPPPSGEGMYVSRFVVAPERQGSGLARSLLAAVRVAAGACGVTSLQLHVRADNARALAFYCRNGFRLMSTAQQKYLLLRDSSCSAP